MPHIAQTRRLARPLLALVLALPLLLAGCGQKGDLYLPDKQAATSHSATQA